MDGSWDRGLLGRSNFVFFIFGWDGGDGGGRGWGGYGLSHM